MGNGQTVNIRKTPKIHIFCKIMVGQALQREKTVIIVMNRKSIIHHKVPIDKMSTTKSSIKSDFVKHIFEANHENC